MFRTILGVFDLLEKFGMLLAGLCLAIIMFIVTGDAAFRYLFNAPFNWSYDLITLYLLTAATFFALSSTFKVGGHITIDFVTQFMPPNVMRVCTAICDFAMLPILAFMFYTAALDCYEAYTQNRFNPGVLTWRAWPTSALISFGVGLLFIRVLIDCVRQLRDAAQNKPSHATTPQDDIL